MKLKKILNNNDHSDENEDFGHCNQFLAFLFFLALYDPDISVQGSQCVYLS